MTQRIEPSFWTCFNELNLLLFDVTQRVEPFSWYDSKNWTFFSVTQRIVFFKRLTELISFVKYDSKNWTFFECDSKNWIQKHDSKNWNFYEYDAKNWTLFWIWLKELSLFSVWLKELNFFSIWLKKMSPLIKVCFKKLIISKIWLKELNLFFFLNTTHRIEPFFEYDSQNCTFFFECDSKN